MNKLALPAGFIARAAVEGDQPAVAELFFTIERSLYGYANDTPASLITWLTTTWQTQGFQLEADSRVIVAPDKRCIVFVFCLKKNHKAVRCF